MPRWLFLVAMTASLGAASTWKFAGPTTPGDDNTMPGASRLRAPGSSNKDEPLLFAPKAGRRYTYAFTRDLRFGGFSGFGGQEPTISFRGTLHLDILQVHENGFTALAREQVEGQAPNDVAVKLRLSDTGEDLELRAPKLIHESDRQHLDVLKDLLANFAFPSARDTVGPYRFELKRLSANATHLQFQKRKLRYELAPPVPDFVASLHLLKWSRQWHMPEETTGRETTRLGEHGLVSETAYLLRLTAVSASPKISPRLLSTLSQPSSVAVSARPLAEKVLDPAQHWPATRARLLTLGKLSQGEQLGLFGFLARLIKGNPGLVNELLALLREQNAIKTSSQLFRIVVGALSTEGSAEALAALRSLYQDPECPIAGRGTVLASLTTTEAPLDSATRAFLMALVADESHPSLSFGAAFALGAALQSAPANDGQVPAAVQQLLAYYENARTLDAQLAALDAMGNSGRIEFFPLLRSVAHTGAHPQLKAKAVFSLRFLASDSARDLLGQSLSQGELAVRAGAVAAMGLAPWHAAFGPAIQQCAAQEAVAEILSECRKIHALRFAHAANSN